MLNSAFHYANMRLSISYSDLIHLDADGETLSYPNTPYIIQIS
jgi:hypothetical protein